MSFGQASNSLSLFGQQTTVATPATGLSAAGPQLDVPWGSFHQSLGSSLRALLGGPSARGKFLSGEFFKDCWIERRIPSRTVLAAPLRHIIFLGLPWPQVPAQARQK